MSKIKNIPTPSLRANAKQSSLTTWQAFSGLPQSLRLLAMTNHRIFNRLKKKISLNVKLFLLLLFFPVLANAAAQEPLQNIQHIVVIYLENHSFDNLFGNFPNANGFAQAGDRLIQTDKDNKPYATLPPVVKDKRFPDNLPNQPFLITNYVPENENTGDLVHRFYQLQAQMNNGKMDKFVLEGNSGALPMGYYENKNSPLWQYAQKYTLADNYFTGVWGGSFVNHLFMICACVPRYEHAADALKAELDANGKLIKDAPLTPDGYAVNTIEPFYPPYNPKVQDATKRLPPLTQATIGDRLNEKNISWVWYAGGWNKALKKQEVADEFIYHHQPFVYFANYAPDSKARAEHLKDEADFITAIENNTLPAVAFYKPSGQYDVHPHYANLVEGEKHVFDIIGKIEQSKAWETTLILVTFDDAGGAYDHVMPPRLDRFGAGERVPLLIISPFAKHNFVDNTQYDTASIAKLIETRFNLKALGKRDAEAGDLSHTLENRQ